MDCLEEEVCSLCPTVLLGRKMEEGWAQDIRSDLILPDAQCAKDLSSSESAPSMGVQRDPLLLVSRSQSQRKQRLAHKRW